MSVEEYFIYFFLGFVLIVSLLVGWLLREQAPSEIRRNPLDPERIQKEMLDDTSLSEEELVWAKELASLELPRRHLIC